MITKWLVETNRDSSLSRQEVKDIIRENNYTSIDVGAGVNFWSYPECTIVADILKIDNFSHYDSTGTPIKKVLAAGEQMVLKHKIIIGGDLTDEEINQFAADFK